MEPERAALDIETLRKRHDALKQKRAAAQAMLEQSRERLDSLETEAREKYGTNKLGELREKLGEMKADNRARRLEYQKHLEGLEEKLAAVEREHVDAAGEADDA